MSTHELLGRAVEAKETAEGQLQRTLELLMEIKAGHITLDRVTVSKTGWNVAEAPDGGDGGESVPAVAGRVGAKKAGGGKAG